MVAFIFSLVSLTKKNSVLACFFCKNLWDAYWDKYRASKANIKPHKWYLHGLLWIWFRIPFVGWPIKIHLIASGIQSDSFVSLAWGIGLTVIDLIAKALAPYVPIFINWSRRLVQRIFQR